MLFVAAISTAVAVAATSLQMSLLLGCSLLSNRSKCNSRDSDSNRGSEAMEVASHISAVATSPPEAASPSCVTATAVASLLLLYLMLLLLLLQLLL
jgi:hypothetical protein